MFLNGILDIANHWIHKPHQMYSVRTTSKIL